MIDGFAEFGSRLSEVPRTADPAGDLLAMGHAYRDTALANPTTYAVMFGRAVPDFEPSPDALTTAVEVFMILVDGVQRVIDAGQFRRDDPEEIAFVLWATTHGFASLEMAGYGDKPPTKQAIPGKGPRYLFDVACRALLQGFATD